MHSVEIKNLVKSYGSQKALDDVNICIDKGEVVGLLGPNGAGKSTLMKILTAYIPATSGSVLVNGQNVDEFQLDIRRQLGYLPENNPLYTDMYIKEYLSFVLKMYSTPFNTKQRVEEMIELTGLGREQKKKIGALSKGYRQRVGLAQALIHDPELLILDEPTSGLDPNQLVDIRTIISDLGKTKTILLSTHIMQEVEAVCGRVIIIDKGKIVADDNTSKLSHMGTNKIGFKVEFKELVNKSELIKITSVESIEKINNNIWILYSKSNKDIREDIFKFAVDKGYSVLSLSQTETSMEDVFRNLTK
ncbi:MAG: gliding motility-associated ABC transporter ATP-binding subunit GldA [Marinilabiliales bacterium]|nr:MAG: gliding motility-associated ABC transporter ATP-binding subunit GldA [Marinilabiliales bacterium]